MTTSLARCLLTLIVGATGLTAADPTLVEVSLPDLERSRQRLAAGLYGRAWMDPALADLRAHLAERGAELGAEAGLDPLTLWLDSEGLELQVVQPVGQRDPAGSLQLRGAALVTAMAALLRERGMSEAESGARIEDLAFNVEEATLLLAGEGAVLSPLTVATGVHDLVWRWHPEAIVAAIEAQTAPREAAMVGLFADLLPSGRLVGDLTARGAQLRLELASAPAGLAPVDRALLARLPQDALAVYAIGLDGAGWWAAHGEAVMAVAADAVPGAGGDRAAAEQQLGAMIGVLGIPGGLGGLAASIDGTAAVVVDNRGTLVPAAAIAVPRSQGLDTMITLGLGMAGMLVPPEGQQRFLVLRGVGDRGQDLVPGVAIGRDASHWWLSSDAVFLAGLLAGELGGWPASPAGQAALAQASEDASIIGAADSTALLRHLIPLATTSASFLDHGLHAQAVGNATLRLAREAGFDTLVAQAGEDGWTMRAEGALTGLTAVSTLVAPIVSFAGYSSDLTTSRSAAQEAAVAATLRSGIFTGQETWRAAAHNDLDQDNRGEYGFLPQLAGHASAFGTDGSDGIAADQVQLLGPEFTGPDAVIKGYHFQVWLGNGAGGAYDHETYRAAIGELTPEAIDSNEIYYVCYAWPDRPGIDGDHVYAITNGGRVFRAPVDQVLLPPAWDSFHPGAEHMRDLRQAAEPWTPW